MNSRIAIAVVLAALAISGCASLRDSYSNAVSGATTQSAREARPYPAATDQGRF